MSDLSRIPVAALRAVEAVGRHGTLAAAADALGVTPGAVSQRLLEVEKRLGLPLFERTPRGMVPTEAGARALPHLTEGFRQLETALARARPAAADGLTVSAAPVFTARWLIWRLPAFHAAHPGLRVRIDASLGLANLDRDGVDVAIRVGRGGWPGVRTEKLFPQVLFPVCTPALADRLKTPADLAHVPVITEPRGAYSWDDWLGPEGALGQALGAGPEFSDASLGLDAAISGEGVLLAFESLAADALARGSVVAPFAGRHATKNAYWLVQPDRPPGAAAVLFVRWLKAALREAGFGRTSPPRPRPPPTA